VEILMEPLVKMGVITLASRLSGTKLNLIGALS